MGTRFQPKEVSGIIVVPTDAVKSQMNIGCGGGRREKVLPDRTCRHVMKSSLHCDWSALGASSLRRQAGCGTFRLAGLAPRSLVMASFLRNARHLVDGI